jgi:hypothetical protein
MINARRFSCAHVLRAQQRWLTDLPYQPEAYGIAALLQRKKVRVFQDNHGMRLADRRDSSCPVSGGLKSLHLVFPS